MPTRSSISSARSEILTLYLNLAPYGGNIEGIRAACLAYFGKEPARLTTAEAALLVALPQSPEARRPDRDPQGGAGGPQSRARPHGRAKASSRADEAEAAKTRADPHGAPRFPDARGASRR